MRSRPPERGCCGPLRDRASDGPDSVPGRFATNGALCWNLTDLRRCERVFVASNPSDFWRCLRRGYLKQEELGKSRRIASAGPLIEASFGAGLDLVPAGA